MKKLQDRLDELEAMPSRSHLAMGVREGLQAIRAQSAASMASSSSSRSCSFFISRGPAWDRRGAAATGLAFSFFLRVRFFWRISLRFAQVGKLGFDPRHLFLPGLLAPCPSSRATILGVPGCVRKREQALSVALLPPASRRRTSRAVKDPRHGVVIGSGDRVVFVVVAAGAGDGHSRKRGGDVDLVVDDVVMELLGILRVDPFGADRQKTRRDQQVVALGGVSRLQQVSRELLDDEPVVRLSALNESIT